MEIFGKIWNILVIYPENFENNWGQSESLHFSEKAEAHESENFLPCKSPLKWDKSSNLWGQIKNRQMRLTEKFLHIVTKHKYEEQEYLY